MLRSEKIDRFEDPHTGVVLQFLVTDLYISIVHPTKITEFMQNIIEYKRKDPRTRNGPPTVLIKPGHHPKKLPVPSIYVRLH
jgi:hypothetical protein